MKSSNVVKQIVIVSLNLAIFYFLIRWVVENIRPDALADALIRISPTAIGCAILANTVAVVFCSFRLAVLLRQPFWFSFRIVNLGLGLNAVLPLRMGDVARIYYANKLFSLSGTKLLATGLMEKFFDIIALGCLVVLVLMLQGGGYVGAGLAEILFGLIFAGLLGVAILHKFADGLERKFSDIAWAKTLISGLREHGRVHSLPKVSGYTLAIWISNVLVAYLGFALLLPTAGVAVQDAVTLLLIIALAIAIPGAPSGLGVFEAGIVAYLTQSFNIENELALACAFAFHMAITIPQIIGAAMILLWGRRPVPGRQSTTSLPRG